MDVTIVDALVGLIVVVCVALILCGYWRCLCYGGRDEQAGGGKQPSDHALKQETAARWRIWTGSLALLAALLSATPWTAEADAAATIFEKAMQDYERGDYVRAQMKFRIAADSGDARAQEIVGLMYAVGPQLYPGIVQDLRAAAAWLDRAARGGRPGCALRVPCPRTEGTTYARAALEMLRPGGGNR